MPPWNLYHPIRLLQHRLFGPLTLNPCLLTRFTENEFPQVQLGAEDDFQRLPYCADSARLAGVDAIRILGCVSGWLMRAYEGGIGGYADATLVLAEGVERAVRRLGFAEVLFPEEAAGTLDGDCVAVRTEATDRLVDEAVVLGGVEAGRRHVGLATEPAPEFGRNGSGVVFYDPVPGVHVFVVPCTTVAEPEEVPSVTIGRAGLFMFLTQHIS